jgi:hypothetical protein
MLQRRLPPFGGSPSLSTPGGSTEQWLLFDELVVGSGHAGEYVSETSLAATQSFAHLPPDEDILLEFRERLYKAHGVLPPQRRSTSLRSHQDEKTPRQLKVLIADNERFSPVFMKVLQEAAQELNASTQLTPVAAGSNISKGGESVLYNASAGSSFLEHGSPRRTGPLDVKFVDWAQLQPWREQLKLLREADILVSGIGTSLFYSLLMPDGAATVNLGWNRPRDAWGGPRKHGERDAGIADPAAGMPSYGEEFLGMSNRRAKMFFLPLHQVRRGPSPADISSMIRHAESRIRQGFDIPVARPEDNLSIFGKILLDLQRKSEVSAKGLAGLPIPVHDDIHVNELYEAALSKASRPQVQTALNELTPPNVFLHAAYEEQLCHTRATGQGSASPVVLEQTFNQQVIGPCHVDLPLLRQLKIEYKLKEALGVTTECECVVCEACGLD